MAVLVFGQPPIELYSSQAASTCMCVCVVVCERATSTLPISNSFTSFELAEGAYMRLHISVAFILGNNSSCTYALIPMHICMCVRTGKHGLRCGRQGGVVGLYNLVELVKTAFHSHCWCCFGCCYWCCCAALQLTFVIAYVGVGKCGAIWFVSVFIVMPINILTFIL